MVILLQTLIIRSPLQTATITVEATGPRTTVVSLHFVITTDLQIVHLKSIQKYTK